MSSVAHVIRSARQGARRGLREHRYLLIVVGIGLMIRLIWVIWASREPTGIFDPSLYRHSGVHIGSGNGYLSYGDNPTAYYPPGYPYFIGLLYLVARVVSLTDSYTLIIGLVQALLSAGTILLVGLIAQRIAGRTAGLVAAVCFAMWPSAIVYTSIILSETLYMFLLAGFVLSAMYLPSAQELTDCRNRSGVDGDSRRGSMSLLLRSPAFWSTGLFLAAGVLTRPQSALIGIPVLAIVWWSAGISLRVVVERTVLLIVAVVVVLTPWTIRNAVQLDGFVPLSNNTGHNLCIGFNPNATGGFMLPDICDQTDPYVTSTAAELEHNAVNQRVALRSIRDDWARLPALSVKKLWYTFNGDTAAVRALESYHDDAFLTVNQRNALQGAASVTYYSFLFISLGTSVLLFGKYWRARREATGFIVVVGLLLGGALVPVVSFGDQRFKDSLYPLIAVLVGVGLVNLWMYLRHKRMLR